MYIYNNNEKICTYLVKKSIEGYVHIQYNIISSREQRKAKGESDVIERCTGDTNRIPGNRIRG